MEGLVPGNRVDQFRDQLKEGCVYTIDNFDLYDPKKTYRSVDHPLRICFTMRTILTGCLFHTLDHLIYLCLPTFYLSVDGSMLFSGW